MRLPPAFRFTWWIIAVAVAVILGTAVLCILSPSDERPANNVAFVRNSTLHSGQTHASPAMEPPPASDPVPVQHPNRIPADGDIPADFLNRIVAGNKVSFALPDGSEARGGIELIEHDARGILFIQGRLAHPEPGFYFFQRQTVAGLAGPFVGHVRFNGCKDAWKIEPNGVNGASRFNARKLDEIVCVSYSHRHDDEAHASEGGVEHAPQAYPADIPIPTYQTIIPLSSLPGATAVIYLDFDGEEGPFPGWGDFDAAPAGATNNEVHDVWKMVCEDFQGFNVNVTTDREVYNQAQEGRRTHCIISPTTTASPGAGGVAYVGSFNWSGDRVCWAFHATGKSACEVISHEIGHTLGLSHDGKTNPALDYYGGHGTDPTGWAPIMGVGYSKKLTQWSKGEYLNASQKQDDLNIIVSSNNGVDFRDDDTGDVLTSARYLEIAADDSVSNEGVLERTGDVDSYRFATTGGQATIHVNTVTLNPNLDLLAEIVDASNLGVVFSDDPDHDINATVSANLPAGEYLLRIRGTGRGNPLLDGYTNYGCVGSYIVSGSVSGGIKSERFTIAENSANGSGVGTVQPRKDHSGAPLAFSIAGGNVGGAFSIHPLTGAISVANSAALDYEVLSLRWDDPATIELFVTIADAGNPSLDEYLRMVITVANLNESPVLSGGSVTILEHSFPGTNIHQVTAVDPDRYDLVTYCIAGGDPGGWFQIDAGTGLITTNANIDVAADTVIDLTVQAADQGTPALAGSAVVTVTVVKTVDGYQPGRITRTYFENISGNAVTNLTNNAKFPNNPDSEEFITSFDGLPHGYDFGSTIRGYLIPPVTGTYQFWIAADDSGQMFLSTNASPANASVMASVSERTGAYAWTTNSSQQSPPVTLTAGHPYYIEARHKEGYITDHVAVAWSGPGIPRQVISGLYLAPFYQNHAPKLDHASFSIRENAVAGQSPGTVTSGDVNAQDTPGGYTITGGNTNDVFGIEPASGRLFVTAKGILNVVTKPVYTLTIRVTDNGTPALSGSGTVTVNVLPPTGVTVTGVVQEIWTGISGTTLSNLTGNTNHPYKPNVRRMLPSFNSGTGYGDNYGSRIRARFIPPISGAYQFFIASDDDSRLLFSDNATGAGATQIASLNGWTDANQWMKFSSQSSVIKHLVAGQPVYLEALHKQGGSSDHLSVGFTNAATTAITVIPGSMLQPFDINAPPVFAPANYSFALNGATAIQGTLVGNVTATDPNGEPLAHAILSGNPSGAFAIHPGTGAIIVDNPAALADGTVDLQVEVQDGGLSAVYPLASATASVRINVTGVNHTPTFGHSIITGPSGTPNTPYSSTLAGTAADPDDGDTLVFSKTSGPAWLQVAASGSLTGTPDGSDLGTGTFTIRATDRGGLFAEATLEIPVVAVNPDVNGNGILDTWETVNFGNVNQIENPPDADADSDGLSNLMEFALGTRPDQPNASPLDVGFITIGGDRFLLLTVPKNPQATNLNYSVEVCGDPAVGNWSAIPTVIVAETPSGLMVRDATPQQSAPARFIRLKVRTLP